MRSSFVKPICKSTKVLFCCLLLLGITACRWFLNSSAEPKTYITVAELLRRPELKGKQVYVMGGIVEETVIINPTNQIILFEFVHVPAAIDRGGESEAAAVARAKRDPNAVRIKVSFQGVLPPEATTRQAIIVGKLGDDGIFHADQLLVMAHDESLHTLFSFGLCEGCSFLTPTPGATP